jgi:hypothetical protein
VVPQTFQSVTRGEKETSVKFTRAPDTVDGAVIIAEQALDAQALDFLLPPAAQTRIDGVNFNRRFLIAVYLSDGKSGYKVNVTRIGVARVSRAKRQFCITAAITAPSPNAPETGYAWLQTHVVSIPTRKLPTVPNNWVLRTTAGKLLSVSQFTNDLGTYRRPTGVAAACPK